jgi:hypothetical protein
MLRRLHDRDDVVGLVGAAVSVGPLPAAGAAVTAAHTRQHGLAPFFDDLDDVDDARWTN